MNQHLWPAIALANIPPWFVQNVLDFATAVPLARFRGEVMQQAVPVGQGAMAAVLGLDNDKLAEVCVEASQGQVVEAVNFNAPGQVVIAGDSDAVARAIDSSQNAGAKRAVILPLSVPSHSSLMQPAARRCVIILRILYSSHLMLA